MHFQHIKVWRRIYALVNQVIIGLGDILSPAWQRPFSEPIMTYFYPLNTKFIDSKYNGFHSRTCIWRYRLQNYSQIVLASICWLKCLLQISTSVLYWLNGKPSYHQASWRLGATRLGFRVIKSLWNLTAASATLLLRHLSSFIAVGSL